jgi:hypothetical protein
MTTEQIARRYKGRICAVLNAIASALQDAGYLADDPCDLSGDDDYRFTFTVHRDGDINEFSPEDIDVSLEVCPSEDFDGETGGVNFSLRVVEVGGRILGGLTPYNYTPEVWVNRKDNRAIEERLSIFEEADPDGVVQLIEAA